MLCKILAEKEMNPIGYSIKRAGEKISAKCIICDTVVALGDYSKRIYNLKAHSNQQGHQINLLFHQSGESAVAIKFEQLWKRTTMAYSKSRIWKLYVICAREMGYKEERGIIISLEMQSSM